MFCFTLNTFQHTVSYWIPFSTLLCSVFQTEYLSAHCYMFCVSHWIPFSTLFHVVCFTLNTFQHTVSCCLFHTEYLSAHCFVFCVSHWIPFSTTVPCSVLEKPWFTKSSLTDRHTVPLRTKVLCSVLFMFCVPHQKWKTQTCHHSILRVQQPVVQHQFIKYLTMCTP